MDTRLIRLDESLAGEGALVGGKAARLAGLRQAGLITPRGWCIPVGAYREFLAENHLDKVLQYELGRKSLSNMRWEELWDSALRIRSSFLRAPLPAWLRNELTAVAQDRSWVVRSSSPDEDSLQVSFAGLHCSFVGVTGGTAVCEAVRKVWASLWSDAALLYRRELGLSLRGSAMAVLLQPLVAGGPSGVVFSQAPGSTGCMLVEAVPGLCEELVSGRVEPQAWEVATDGGSVRRLDAREPPLLSKDALLDLVSLVKTVEKLCGWPADVEWTRAGGRTTVLQARPVTQITDGADDRSWYLSLKPGRLRLEKLYKRVLEERIPELSELGARLAAEDLKGLSKDDLARALQARGEAVDRWKTIYKEEFIPFAHGVRQFGQYYNDNIRPEDPYEFVHLLRGQPMLAQRRNDALEGLRQQLEESPGLKAAVLQAAEAGQFPNSEIAGTTFVRSFGKVLEEHFDVTYAGQRLLDHPITVLRIVLQKARQVGTWERSDESWEGLVAGLDGSDRQEALHRLRLGQLSWRLRDDDNLLVGRLESQLIRAEREAIRRLEEERRLKGPVQAGQGLWRRLAKALTGSQSVEPVEAPPASAEPAPRAHRARQLVGQPASPGLATGLARVVVDLASMRAFRAGEVLVCDAIQPQMTHLVPLACAIVERRGGMLIHGAIIARELGLPCVNGVARATTQIDDGELLAVDGFLGVVTLGPADFSLERDS